MRRRASKPERPLLTKAARALLGNLAAGGRLTARRDFPFPHRFTLEVPNGFSDQSVPASQVSELVSLGLLAGRPFGARSRRSPEFTDLIEYTITGEGERAVKLGAEWRAPTEKQEELFGGAR